MKDFDFNKETCECCRGFNPADKYFRIWKWGVSYTEKNKNKEQYVLARYCPMCGRRLTDD